MTTGWAVLFIAFLTTAWYVLRGMWALRDAREDWERHTREAENLTLPIGPEDDPDWQP